MSRVPSELLIETLLFLKRHDIEEKQLVCKTWKAAIARNASRLPVRVLNSVGICSGETDEDESGEKCKL